MFHGHQIKLILKYIREGKLNIIESLGNIGLLTELPQGGENIGHQLLISQPPPLLSVGGVEGVSNEQAANMRIEV